MKQRARHILILVENLPVPFDRRVWQEACALRDAGYRVSVVCPQMRGWKKAYELLEGINVYRHPLPEAQTSSASVYIREYAAALYQQSKLAWKIWLSDPFDAIHACNPPDLLFAVAAPFMLMGVKFIFDHHDVNPELFEVKFGRQGLKNRLAYAAICLAERLTFFCSRRASIATNQSYKRVAIQRGKMPARRVFVVRSAPDMKRFLAVPANPAWRKGRRHLIGYLGTIGPQEGLQFLIEAAVILKAKRPADDLQWLVIGEGPAWEDVKRLAEKRGLGSEITFAGRLPDREMIEAIGSCDLCINTDLATPMNDKSTMNKIIEYMALGRPMVQFDLTEGRVSAGLASLYARNNDAADLAEKIETLVENPSLRQQMGEYGRRRVEQQLAWKYSVPVLLDAYQTLFGDRVVRTSPELDDRPAKNTTPTRPGENSRGPQQPMINAGVA